jgi:quinol monooxygenase YgiN
VFALVVRFDLLDTTAAEAFDALVVDLLPAIAAHEPSTLIYTVHAVHDAPLSRIFYECYVDRDALDTHEAQPHTAHFLHEKDALLSGVRVEHLTPAGGTGIGAGA